MLEIVSFTLGPVQTNAYLVADSETKEAVVIDPAWDGVIILAEAQKRGWRIGHLWYTHAHFDHIGGAGAIADSLNQLPLVALHPNDHVLWRAGGGGAIFGFDIDPGPEPTIDFVHGQILKFGNYEFEVRFTPGHTMGNCVLYVATEGVCFCGDLIFNGSVGRTDLPGGDWNALVKSIQEQIFTMPDETRLLSGHGPETTVGEEKRSNPFVGEM
jgi:hydroxyacylglutathione hydrolase